MIELSTVTAGDTGATNASEQMRAQAGSARVAERAMGSRRDRRALAAILGAGIAAETIEFLPPAALRRLAGWARYRPSI